MPHTVGRCVVVRCCALLGALHRVQGDRQRKKASGAFAAKALIHNVFCGSPTRARIWDLRINSPTTERAGNPRQWSLSSVLLSEISVKFMPRLPGFLQVHGPNFRQLIRPKRGGVGRTHTRVERCERRINGWKLGQRSSARSMRKMQSDSRATAWPPGDGRDLTEHPLGSLRP